MSSDFEGWFNLPKSVKLLDVSIFGYGILLAVGIILYYLALDQTVQNLIPIFLVAILLLFTWNFRSKIHSAPDQTLQKQYFREWIIISVLAILVAITIIMVYPVTY